ncbi:hypothetical protein ACGFSB_36875 [Streptomyces sp. NPDC048441]|uniref:hypothetical protein n=1 Tax=Streptomyces sp. NPDC048441 TaxID=3365552 RepID=UPI00371D51D7
MTTYKDRGSAAAGFAKEQDHYDPGLESYALVAADEAVAGSGCMGQNTGCFSIIIVREGAIVGWVNLNTENGPRTDPKALNSATRMLVERMRQLQDGERPTAQLP